MPPVNEPGNVSGNEGGGKKKGVHWGVWVGGGLLVLLVPCVILAAILVPVFMQARVAADKTEILSQLKQSGVAMIIYQAEWEDTFPPDMSSGEAVEKALKESDLDFEAEVRPGEFLVPNAELAGVNGFELESPNTTPMVTFESESVPGGLFTIYADGSVRFEKFEEEEF